MEGTSQFPEPARFLLEPGRATRPPANLSPHLPRGQEGFRGLCIVSSAEVQGPREPSLPLFLPPTAPHPSRARSILPTGLLGFALTLSEGAPQVLPDLQTTFRVPLDLNTTLSPLEGYGSEG